MFEDRGEARMVHSPRVVVGVQTRCTQKDEDRVYVRSAARHHCIAVFDGHGGRLASEACLKTVGARLLEAGPPFDDARIAGAFWDADLALGAAGEMSGTTATVLLVEQRADGGLDGVLAWVGDSAAVRVDMQAPAAKAMVEVTPMHNPHNADEVDRLQTLWTVPGSSF